MRKGVIRAMVLAASDYALLNTLKDFCLLMCLCVHISASDCGGQSRASDLLELELQAVVSHLPGMLGTEPGSSARTVVSLNDCYSAFCT